MLYQSVANEFPNEDPPPVLELSPSNRPDLTIRIDAADAHLLATCKSWWADKKPNSLTLYVQVEADHAAAQT